MLAKHLCLLLRMKRTMSGRSEARLLQRAHPGSVSHLCSSRLCISLVYPSLSGATCDPAWADPGSTHLISKAHMHVTPALPSAVVPYTPVASTPEVLDAAVAVQYGNPDSSSSCRLLCPSRQSLHLQKKARHASSSGAPEIKESMNVGCDGRHWGRLQQPTHSGQKNLQKKVRHASSSGAPEIKESMNVGCCG